MKIRIISTPDGEAPKEIRKVWVGLELELDPHVEQPSTISLTNVRTIKKLPNSQNVYLVTCEEAFDKLIEKSKTMYRWWWENTSFPLYPERHLAFPAKACEPIST